MSENKNPSGPYYGALTDANGRILALIYPSEDAAYKVFKRVPLEGFDFEYVESTEKFFVREEYQEAREKAYKERTLKDA